MVVHLVLEARIAGNVGARHAAQIKRGGIRKDDALPTHEYPRLTERDLIVVGADEFASLRDEQISPRGSVVDVLTDLCDELAWCIAIDATNHQRRNDGAGLDLIRRYRGGAAMVQVIVGIELRVQPSLLGALSIGAIERSGLSAAGEGCDSTQSRGSIAHRAAVAVSRCRGLARGGGRYLLINGDGGCGLESLPFGIEVLVLYLCRVTLVVLPQLIARGTPAASLRRARSHVAGGRRRHGRRGGERLRACRAGSGSRATGSRDDPAGRRVFHKRGRCVAGGRLGRVGGGCGSLSVRRHALVVGVNHRARECQGDPYSDEDRNMIEATNACLAHDGPWRPGSSSPRRGRVGRSRRT